MFVNGPLFHAFKINSNKQEEVDFRSCFDEISPAGYLHVIRCAHRAGDKKTIQARH